MAFNREKKKKNSVQRLYSIKYIHYNFFFFALQIKRFFSSSFYGCHPKLCPHTISETSLTFLFSKNEKQKKIDNNGGSFFYGIFKLIIRKKNLSEAFFSFFVSYQKASKFTRIHVKTHANLNWTQHNLYGILCFIFRFIALMILWT